MLRADLPTARHSDDLILGSRCSRRLRNHFTSAKISVAQAHGDALELELTQDQVVALAKSITFQEVIGELLSRRQ
jgi:hypothetical protein